MKISPNFGDVDGMLSELRTTQIDKEKAFAKDHLYHQFSRFM